jgi:hypothetical protein
MLGKCSHIFFLLTLFAFCFFPDASLPSLPSACYCVGYHTLLPLPLVLESKDLIGRHGSPFFSMRSTLVANLSFRFSFQNRQIGEESNYRSTTCRCSTSQSMRHIIIRLAGNPAPKLHLEYVCYSSRRSHRFSVDDFPNPNNRDSTSTGLSATDRPTL